MNKTEMIKELLNDKIFIECFYTETLETMNKRHITDIEELYFTMLNKNKKVIK